MADGEILDFNKNEKPKLRITEDDFNDYKCTNCGCKHFKQSHIFMTLSPLRSPDGKQKSVLRNTFICEKCGNEIDIEILQNLMMPQHSPEG